jgi:putative transposase
MPRQPRIVVEGEPAVYHIISRTALDGFVLGDAEKDHLLKLIRNLSAVYFAEVLAFCVMGNHFHLVVRMHPGDDCSEQEIGQRFSRYYGKEKRILMPGQIPSFRAKWASISEYVREIKQSFSRYYNRRHKRRGFFWSDRFKSVLVEDGMTLINCLAYVDLNPVRAGIVERPEDYRWNSLGYRLQTGNQGGLLSLDFGLPASGGKSAKQRLAQYRQFVYEKGALPGVKGKALAEETVRKEAHKAFEPGMVDRFRYRTRYFTDSGIIGSREFVRRCWQVFQTGADQRPRNPRPVAGLEGMYSLKRLSEA